MSSLPLSGQSRISDSMSVFDRPSRMAAAVTGRDARNIPLVCEPLAGSASSAGTVELNALPNVPEPAQVT